MQIDKFRIEADGFIFEITEYNENNVVQYEVIITDEPVDFAQMYEVEQPVRMKYDAVTGELKWDSPQDLGMKKLESLLSSKIINYHQ